MPTKTPRKNKKSLDGEIVPEVENRTNKNKSRVLPVRIKDVDYFRIKHISEQVNIPTSALVNIVVNAFTVGYQKKSFNLDNLVSNTIKLGIQDSHLRKGKGRCVLASNLTTGEGEASDPTKERVLKDIMSGINTQAVNLTLRADAPEVPALLRRGWKIYHSTSSTIRLVKTELSVSVEKELDKASLE